MSVNEEVQKDDSVTQLADGSVVAKDEDHIMAVGDIDELNAYIGLIERKFLDSALGMQGEKFFKYSKILRDIENSLFIIGGLFSYKSIRFFCDKLPKLSQKAINELQNNMKEMNEELPPIDGFLVPAGREISCVINVARTVCRRAERSSVALRAFRNKLSYTAFTTEREAYLSSSQIKLAISYLNVLSQWLFVFSRFNNIGYEVKGGISPEQTGV